MGKYSGFNYEEKGTVSWSGGKDSCLVFDGVIVTGIFEAVELHTFYQPGNHKINIHKVPLT